MGCRGRGRFPFPCISLVVNPCFGQRRHSQLLTVKSCNGKLGKIDGEPAIIHRQQAHGLSPENLTQEHFLFLPAKMAFLLHPVHQHRIRILRFRHMGWEASRRQLIHRSRCPHSQRFMRTHSVVFLAEPLHHSLLLAPIACWWLGCLLLQRAMHPLMPPVLLRMPSFNPLRHNPQLHPPHRQARQPGNGSRCKRRPIVGPDRLRHAILAKARFEDRLHSPRVCFLHRLAAEQIPAVGIGDRQRIDSLAVPGSKPAFEIRAPHPVGSVRMRQRFTVRRCPPTFPSPGHQPFPFQQCSDRGSPPATLVPARYPPAPVSTSADPIGYALLAVPTPSARSPPTSGFHAVASLGSSRVALPIPLLYIASATHTRFRARSHISGTVPSSFAAAVDTRIQTSASLPLHCSFSMACTLS